jgi:FkbH-like protein
MKYDYKELRKNLKKDYDDFPKLRIAILSDIATQYLAQSVKALAYEYGFNPEIYEGAFDQMQAEALDIGSGLYAFKPDYVVIFPTAENLKRRLYKTPPEDRPAFVAAESGRILSVADTISNNSDAQIILCNLCEIDDGLYGSYAGSYELSVLSVTRTINLQLTADIRSRSGIHPADIAAAQNLYGSENTFDERMYYLSSNPFTQDFLAVIADRILSVINVLKGHVKKCLITDLDNTLWGGTIGDIGFGNIAIGDLGIGKAYSDLQAWIKELSLRGIAICVCSKNDEDIAMRPFLSHPDMILKLSDIAVFKANWRNKTENITAIKDALNIGYDSMVFIDDNPAERDLVRSVLPDVTVPKLPGDAARVLRYLQSLNLFETAGLSDEDARRTQMYRQEGERAAAKSGAQDIEDYLTGLAMRCRILPFDQYSIPRIAQLLQRTNQFNLRTQRYTEKEIEAFAASDDYITMSVSLEDKFGDYGIIGAVILQKKEDDELFIDSFVMSCRVAKRGVEEYLFNSIALKAGELGIAKITGEYIPTAKNGPVKDLLAEAGFTGTGTGTGGIKSIFADDYVPMSTFVTSKLQ